jgi:hypothetical protein
MGIMRMMPGKEHGPPQHLLRAQHCSMRTEDGAGYAPDPFLHDRQAIESTQERSVLNRWRTLLTVVSRVSITAMRWFSTMMLISSLRSALSMVWAAQISGPHLLLVDEEEGIEWLPTLFRVSLLLSRELIR